MKVLKIYNQYRRDCDCDLECEKCGHLSTDQTAYDDRNFWDNVIPNRKCKSCGESTISMGEKINEIPTKYPEGFVI